MSPNTPLVQVPEILRTILQYFFVIFLGFFIHFKNVVFFKRRQRAYKEFSKLYRHEPTGAFLLRIFLLIFYALLLFFFGGYYTFQLIQGNFGSDRPTFASLYCCLNFFAGMCVVYVIAALNAERQRRLKPSFKQMKWFNISLLLLQVAFFVIPFFFDFGIPQGTITNIKIAIKVTIHLVLLLSYYLDDTEEEAPLSQSLIANHVAEDTGPADERLIVVIKSIYERKFVLRLYDSRMNFLVEVHRSVKAFEELIDQMYQALYTDLLARILRQIKAQLVDMELVESSLNSLLETSLYRNESLANFLNLTNKDIRKRYFSVFANRKVNMEQIFSNYPSIRFKRDYKNLERLTPYCYVTVSNISYASVSAKDQFVEVLILSKQRRIEHIIALQKLDAIVCSLENKFGLRKSKGNLLVIATNLTTVLNESIYVPDKALTELVNLRAIKKLGLTRWTNFKLFLEFNNEAYHPFVTKFNEVVFTRKLCRPSRVVLQHKIRRGLEDLLIFIDHLRIRKINDRNFYDVVLPELINFSSLNTNEVIGMLNTLATKPEIIEMFEARLFFELEDCLS